MPSLQPLCPAQHSYGDLNSINTILLDKASVGNPQRRHSPPHRAVERKKDVRQNNQKG